MKRIIPILLLMLASCKRDFPAVPKDIIPPTEMKDILGDMMIADALSETRGLGGAAEKQYTEQYYQTIFKNHHTTRTEFLKSYSFYESNPVWLNKIYGDVLSDMSKKETELSK